ncbi:MAG: hypothetical protein ACMG6E_07850, partial [Candidatus Roizmanbacteria bacterium]
LHREFVRFANTTTYYISLNGPFHDSIKVDTEFGQVAVPNHTDSELYYLHSSSTSSCTNIRIMGPPFNVPVKLWVMYHIFNTFPNILARNSKSPVSYVFQNYSEAVNESANRIYLPLLNLLISEVEAGDFANIDATAKSHKLPTPFNLASLKAAFVKYGFVTLIATEPLDSEVFTICENTFHPTSFIDNIY